MAWFGNASTSPHQLEGRTITHQKPHGNWTAAGSGAHATFRDPPDMIGCARISGVTAHGGTDIRVCHRIGEWRGIFAPPESIRMDSAGQECPALAIRDRQECLSHRGKACHRWTYIYPGISGAPDMICPAIPKRTREESRQTTSHRKPEIPREYASG
jgi:hypothetical protein